MKTATAKPDEITFLVSVQMFLPLGSKRRSWDAKDYCDEAVKFIETDSEFKRLTNEGWTRTIRYVEINDEVLIILRAPTKGLRP